MPKRVHPVSLEFGLIVGPAEVDPNDVVQWMSSASEAWSAIHGLRREVCCALDVLKWHSEIPDQIEAVVQQIESVERDFPPPATASPDVGPRSPLFGRSAAHLSLPSDLTTVCDMLEAETKDPAHIAHVITDNFFDPLSLIRESGPKIAAAQEQLHEAQLCWKESGLAAITCGPNELLSRRDMRLAAVFTCGDQVWRAGGEKKVMFHDHLLFDEEIEHLISSVSDNGVVFPYKHCKTAVYDGWYWERTNSETHLSREEFALTIIDKVERERRRMRALEHRNASPVINSPKRQAGSDKLHATDSGDIDAIEAKLDAASPEEFEHIVKRILEATGFEDVVVTPQSGDGGVDVRAHKTVDGLFRTKVAVQAKHVTGSIHSPKVREFRGSLEPGETGIIMTTGDFSSGAIDAAMKSGQITLIARSQLIKLIQSLNVRV